jgi:hypothetical protein
MGWPRSLRWRYSLRSLFVVVTLFMIWGGYHANRGWKQRAAEETLRRHGAQVAYGTGRINQGVAETGMSLYQALVHRLWGERPVREVTLYSNLEPEVVDALAALPELQGLGIGPRKFTGTEQNRMYNAGDWGASQSLHEGALAKVLASQNLKRLGFGVWVLSDNDLQAVGQETSLEYLGFVGCKFSERGLASVVTLPRLKHLQMDSCPVTGSQLSGLSSRTLELIDSRNVPFGDEFAGFVARSPKISDLRVAHATIDDDFVSRLGPHPALSSLQFGSKSVTDEAVLALLKLPQLKGVSVPRGTFSAEAAAQLKEQRPTLLINN